MDGNESKYCTVKYAAIGWIRRRYSNIDMACSTYMRPSIHRDLTQPRTQRNAKTLNEVPDIDTWQPASIIHCPVASSWQHRFMKDV